MDSQRFGGAGSGEYDILNEKGRKAFDAGGYNEALGYFKQAIDIEPKNAKAYKNLADVYYSNGELGNAEGLYNKCISCDEAYWPAYLMLGKIKQNKNDFVGARELFIKADNLKPNLIEPKFELAENLIFEEDYDKAVSFLLELIDTAPQDKRYWLYFLMARAYFAKNDFVQSINYLEKATEYNPQFFNGYERLGYVYYLLQKPELSIKNYLQAVMLRPSERETYNLLLTSFSIIPKESQFADEIIAVLEDLIKKETQYDFIYGALAEIFGGKNNFEQSLQYATRACHLNPISNYYFQIAQANYFLKRLDEAIVAFNKVIELEPNDSGAYMGLALTYREKGDLSKFQEYQHRASLL
jgi:superkiller protein 3